MLEAGEEPRFILRRMVIFAAEDVGNADPQALVVATAALQAFELVGLPEGVLPLTQAVVYLALRAQVEHLAHDLRGGAQGGARARRAAGARRSLRNAVDRRSTARWATAQGYRYPHDFEGHYVPRTYLPDALAGARFYQPSASGFERELGPRLAEWRRRAAGEDVNERAGEVEGSGGSGAAD